MSCVYHYKCDGCGLTRESDAGGAPPNGWHTAYVGPSSLFHGCSIQCLVKAAQDACVKLTAYSDKLATSTSPVPYVSPPAPYMKRGR